MATRGSSWKKSETGYGRRISLAEAVSEPRNSVRKRRKMKRRKKTVCERVRSLVGFGKRTGLPLLPSRNADRLGAKSVADQIGAYVTPRPLFAPCVECFCDSSHVLPCFRASYRHCRSETWIDLAFALIGSRLELYNLQSARPAFVELFLEMDKASYR